MPITIARLLILRVCQRGNDPACVSESTSTEICSRARENTSCHHNSHKDYFHPLSWLAEPLRNACWDCIYGMIRSEWTIVTRMMPFGLSDASRKSKRTANNRVPVPLTIVIHERIAHLSTGTVACKIQDHQMPHDQTSKNGLQCHGSLGRPCSGYRRRQLPYV